MNSALAEVCILQSALEIKLTQGRFLVVIIPSKFHKILSIFL